jgi:hypothetical protein
MCEVDHGRQIEEWWLSGRHFVGLVWHTGHPAHVGEYRSAFAGLQGLDELSERGIVGMTCHYCNARVKMNRKRGSIDTI